MKSPRKLTVDMKYHEYIGMSYKQASLEASRIIKQHGWFGSLDRLIVLKEIMDREMVK